MFSNDKDSIRNARVQDCDDIADIIKNSFPNHIIEKTIYCSKKITNFLNSRVVDETDNSLKMMIYEVDNKIVGYIEFKIINNKAHLNYIVVSEELRGKSIGKQMLKKSLKHLPSEVKNIELSVFDYNKIAFDWYKSLGFNIINKFVWLESQLDLKDVKKNINPSITNYRRYLEDYEKFGFSYMFIHIDSKLFNVGILGEKYYKITDVELLLNKDFLNFLHELDINRHIFAIVKESDACILIEKYNYKKVVKSTVLQISKEKLIENLGAL